MVTLPTIALDGAVGLSPVIFYGVECDCPLHAGRLNWCARMDGHPDPSYPMAAAKCGVRLPLASGEPASALHGRIMAALDAAWEAACAEGTMLGGRV